MEVDDEVDDEILRSRLRTDFHVTSGRRSPCRRATSFPGSLFSASLQGRQRRETLETRLVVVVVTKDVRAHC